MREILVYAALCPPGEEHRAAWELLALVLERELGIPVLPETERGEEGKPFFPERPDVRFNLSHSHGGGGLRGPRRGDRRGHRAAADASQAPGGGGWRRRIFSACGPPGRPR